MRTWIINRRKLALSIFAILDGVYPRVGAQAEEQARLIPVLEEKDFIVVPCRDCDVPGYLILIPRAETAMIKNLSPASQAGLGAILGKVESAVKLATNADRIYILRFSEALESVHFHIFPRTGELAAQFRQETKTVESGINGPLLFAWARKKFFVSDPKLLSAKTLATAAQISSILKK